MSAKVISAVVGFTLMMASRSPVAVTVGGATVHIPVPLIFAAVVFGACAVVTVLVVKSLARFHSCPHLRTVST